MDGPAPEDAPVLGQRPPCAVNDGGKDVYAQDVGQIKGALMEAADAAVQGPPALRAPAAAVTLFHQSRQPGRDTLHALGGGEEIGLADDETVQRVVPHPVGGKNHQLGRKGQHGQQVKVRLVVAGDDSGALKVIFSREDKRIPYPTEQPRAHPGEPADKTVEFLLLFLGLRADFEEQPHARHHQESHEQHVKEENQQALEDPECPAKQCPWPAVDKCQNA